MDSKTLATLAFLDAFGAEHSLLTYFADLSGPALRYFLLFAYGSIAPAYIFIFALSVRIGSFFSPLGSDRV